MALQTLLDNFQLNFGPMSDACVEKLKKKSNALWTRYILDFFIGHFIIAPAMISFWRGTWDYSLIYLDEGIFNVIILKC